MNEVLQFKLVRKTHPVVIQDDKGIETKWELREMRAEDRDKYLTQVLSFTRYDSNGKPVGFKTFEGVHAALLGRCMFQMEGENDGKLITPAQLKAWPATVVSTLFKAAQALNSITDKDGQPDEQSEDAEKNE